jgi:hypothetical protein
MRCARAYRAGVPTWIRRTVTGAHWDLPEQQHDPGDRERSVEHLRLTPVFGTAQPLQGVAGALRRYAYDTYSEGQAAHWLLLVAADRVDAGMAHVASMVTRRPVNPITESGVLGETSRHPLGSRWGRGRIDLKHGWMDPLLVLGPWVLATIVVVTGVRGISGLLRRR